MKDDSQASTSIWMATANTPDKSRLRESVRTEVCIIGAWIAGMTTAYLLSREGRSESELKPGEGAIMREGVSKIAVHRDEASNVHKFSAVCPHMGCVVAWNSTEHTWDCRVTVRGSVRKEKFTRDQPTATFRQRNSDPASSVLSAAERPLMTRIFTD